jgi:putative transcriptional regulator
VRAPLSAGQLLVAAPALRDPNFLRTVVLLLEYDDNEGALGVVLSRPSETAVSELLPAWQPVATAPPVVHVGGPVAPTAAIGLIAVRAEDRASLPRAVFAPLPTQPVGSLLLGTVDLDADTALVAPALAGMRLFAGYAGWDAGQLQVEVSEGAWYVLPALPSDPFAPVPGKLWRDVLHRQGPPLSLVGEMPVDPTVN